MSITNLTVTSNTLSFLSYISVKSHRRLPEKQTPRIVYTSCCCYGETSLKRVAPVTMPDLETGSAGDGVGIIRFLKGKSYLVTGATGFLGKVLIEKLLRVSPEIGKIFLLIKSKDQESANKRLYDEIISSDLFKLLKEMHGSSYEAFMKSKLIPVPGDIGEDNLGIKSDVAAKISDEIDVIVSCAGRTTFDDRYDSALNTNVIGPGRLLNFGKSCKKLKLFLHYSTAYVTGKKEGIVLESPLCIGENITPDLNIDSELKLASETVRKFHGFEQTTKLKELGLERAQQYGWENTYTFTKAMGESVIHNKRGDIPVVIIRPSIIESSYNEPFPGWLQGIRMTAPFILAYGKDNVPDLWADSQSFMDIIPVDMVVNATIATMAKHGCSVPNLKVYNVVSTSHANPLRIGEFRDFCHQYLRDSPLSETTKEVELTKFHTSLEGFTSSVFSAIAKGERDMKNGEGELESHTTTLSVKGKRKLKYLVSLAKTYQPYTFFQARFDDKNTRSLIQELSREEREMFKFDARGIDWEHYILNVHLPGTKKELFGI